MALTDVVTVGTGDCRYSVAQGWEQVPEGWTHDDVAGVSTDPEDNVYLITRRKARVIVYDRQGRFLRSWGEDVFTERTHGITVGPDGSVYCTDDGDHTVRKFTPEGKLLMTLGTSGEPSDTGYTGTLESITHGGPPFNRCTNLSVAPSGELYVSDGYGNSRVHRFSADGRLIQSWGEPGTGPGEFNLPHGIWVHPDGRVFVADRENDRIQIFTPDGRYLEEWTDVQRPTQLQITPDGLVYVAELWWRVGSASKRHGPITEDLPARVSVYSPEGKVLSRWGGPNRCDPGMLCAPHGLCVDNRGDIYVGEVTWTFGVSRGVAPADCHTFQKFIRIR